MTQHSMIGNWFVRSLISVENRLTRHDIAYKLYTCTTVSRYMPLYGNVQGLT